MIWEQRKYDNTFEHLHRPLSSSGEVKVASQTPLFQFPAFPVFSRLGNPSPVYPLASAPRLDQQGMEGSLALCSFLSPPKHTSDHRRRDFPLPQVSEEVISHHRCSERLVKTNIWSAKFKVGSCFCSPKMKID